MTRLRRVSSYGVTVVGQDRPGIVADVTGALATLGGNIEDSSMTLLRGHFAWTLVVALEATIGEVDVVLDPLRNTELQIAVVAFEQGAQPVSAPTHWLSVHGSDRPGIVATIATEVAAVGGNITDLTTRLSPELYVVSADVYLPPTCDVVDLTTTLERVAQEIGVRVSLREVDTDDVL